MKVESFTALESEVLSLVSQGIYSFEAMSEKISFSENLLNQTLENLCSRNVLVQDSKTKQYKYDSPINKEMVVLNGNLLLPTTIIRMPEKGFMYVTRGDWYKLPIDFDIRRIIWNVKLVGKNNSTLVEMIKSSVLKERKARIVHNPQYDNIKNKILPYNKNIGLYLNAVGDEITDVTIQFRTQINPADEMSVLHKGFTVRSEISTEQLINELKKPLTERNYVENIRINHIYNLSDFIFSKNEIPVNLIDGKLTFVKITSIKKGYELTYYTFDSYGAINKIDVETYDTPAEAIEKLRNIFKGLASKILAKNDILLEFES